MMVIYDVETVFRAFDNGDNMLAQKLFAVLDREFLQLIPPRLHFPEPYGDLRWAQIVDCHRMRDRRSDRLKHNLFLGCSYWLSFGRIIDAV